MPILPMPTRRAGIDTGWKCNVECKFCYHIFKDTDREPEPIDKVKDSIRSAKLRGNDTIDLVGPGEPTIVPHIGEVIRFAKSLDLRVCIITHGMIAPKRLEEILDAGIDDFLISMHGLEERHNDMIGGIKAGRRGQEKTIAALKERGLSFRVNYVLNSENANEVFGFARYIAGHAPRIVNFINFNPHGEWSGNVKSKDFVADLRAVEPLLDSAIDLLESNGIGVNLRYYPMCRISEAHRKNVCNDLHVMFDPYEWDYSVQPKTYAAYREYGRYISRTIESQTGACSTCGIKTICGGINAQFNAMTDGRLVDPVALSELRDDDFYHYRQHNEAVHLW